MEWLELGPARSLASLPWAQPARGIGVHRPSSATRSGWPKRCATRRHCPSLGPACWPMKRSADGDARLPLAATGRVNAMSRFQPGSHTLPSDPPLAILPPPRRTYGHGRPDLLHRRHGPRAAGRRQPLRSGLRRAAGDAGAATLAPGAGAAADLRHRASTCERSRPAWCSTSPADISWGPDVLVQPDVFVVAPDEARTLTWSRVRTLLLVAEVLSPSTARRRPHPQAAALSGGRRAALLGGGWRRAVGRGVDAGGRFPGDRAGAAHLAAGRGRGSRLCSASRSCSGRSDGGRVTRRRSWYRFTPSVVATSSVRARTNPLSHPPPTL